MNTIGEGKPWRFSHFRKTNGYANMPLDGLWLRAPYLHNGSVPTLRALLFPDERPAEFYRAYDVYDWKNVGFISSGPEAEREGVRFSTKERGNGNGGHLYGTTLDPAAKTALLEYLENQVTQGRCGGHHETLFGKAAAATSSRASALRRVVADLASQGVIVEIVQGLRTFAEQDALYAQGRTGPGAIVTQARGGESNHNYGLAADLCPFTDGKPVVECADDGMERGRRGRGRARSRVGRRLEEISRQTARRAALDDGQRVS